MLGCRLPGKVFLKVALSWILMPAASPSSARLSELNSRQVLDGNVHES
ncbi:hypothetical protein PY650_09845 [Rhizobium calliandrae]|uniref:Uncharacterized protein n=1 Tax=Rhizobium calliandrae TaxID=1312182 RepID=A0ABT7KCR3_9HYPH|nr:hypothetical protein [Rhizobium calliandrae]MDL2405962.1 hypothetical protein [Rhizobium calliandrae]